MKKIMLIASAMSALSLPFSASAIELGEEGGLECGPYGKVGIVGGMITGAESTRLDSTDSEGKKHLSLTTGLPFGGTLAAGMTIAPGFRAELGVMYLRNISAEVEVGKGKVDSKGEIKADSGGGTDTPIRKRFKLTPPQPTIMPISIADRDVGVDTDILAQAAAGQPQLTVEQRAADRIAWLKNYAGIDYMVPDPQNPNARVINPVLLNITQGPPNVQPRPRQNLDILDHGQWRHLVVGVTALSHANKPSVTPVKVLSDKITKIYSDIKPFADIAGIDVPDTGLPNSASVEQIQSKMQELNDVLEDLRDSFDGYMGNAFANQIQLNFVMPQQAQQQQGQGQQQQAQATAQEAVAAAAVRLLNGNDQIAQLYKDLVKLQRHAGVKKAMEKLAAQQEEDAKNQGEGDCKQQQGASEKSKEGKGKETEFDLSMIVGQVKLYADLFTTESFSIYAGVGAGLAHTYGKIDDKDIKGHTGMVASGALGVAINAAEGVYVDLEGSYMHSFSKIEEKYSINPLMASVGVRYNF
ncbi:Type surface antigen 56 (56 kDa) [Orientia tsutsugamushi str. Gilliam]|uniref:56 kDa type-specific antigen n=7 Tax=Orientia tsutsugamushi TaxID=784 RepID=TSAG_ORITS|nr:type-specific antigen TSA56 [Orientia tsutsugamushi]P22940.1 RecName: Full=56 kDa type-specific antigen; Short=TSA; AltName: Full=56 kDa scrub typhus antigen; AltName: Full=STA56; AltName: Full=TSG56; Flags: Precursor [Orientia tsutsugamushi]ACY75488.1 56-kDa type-specific antigen [Orientia tsutsugamushi]SPR11258.1 Type surface antigen 56 (56 kDa) [Orientia tsutsugamushi str. Gilliam]